jgi:hypothetical protein
MRCDRGMLALVVVLAAPVSAVADLVDPGHEGVVVEQGSGAPLAGAKVIGKWMVTYSSLAHSGERCVKALVVESDAAGHFRLPPWKRTDTRVTSMDLIVYAYKPGYRLDRYSDPIVAYPGAIARLLNSGGDVTLPKGNAIRVQMMRWNPEPVQRREYLLDFLPSVGCGGTLAEWGTLYFVTRAVYDEFAAFPPEVQRTSKMDYILWLKQVVDDDRAQLQRENPWWKEAN